LKETRPLWPPQRGVGLREPNLGKTNLRVSLAYSLGICFSPSLSWTRFFITNANPACSCVYICKSQFRPIHPPSRRLSGTLCRDFPIHEGSLGLHRAHAQHRACGPGLPRQQAPSPRPSGPPRREGAPRLPPQAWGTLRQRGGSESLARTPRSTGLQPGHPTGTVLDPVPTPDYYHKVLGGDETGTVARGLSSGLPTGWNGR
jgi:hypothetical protein